MGNVTFGVPEDLAIDLKRALNANVFIETGTYKGNTALWASKNFKQVYTIEFDEHRFNKTVARISNMENVENIGFIQGNSKDALKGVLDHIDEPIIFWLDAHGLYAGNMTLEDEIPLMQELQNIFEWKKRTNKECAILIDDARLFLNPPPIDKGYHPEYWPTYPDIVKNIDDNLGKEYFIYQAKDVIVIASKQHETIFDKWRAK